MPPLGLALLCQNSNQFSASEHVWNSKVPSGERGIVTKYMFGCVLGDSQVVQTIDWGLNQVCLLLLSSLWGAFPLYKGSYGT